MSLGEDFAGVDDLDWDLSSVSGPLCYLQAVAHAILSDRDSLEYAPGWGRGLDRYLSAAASGATVAADIVAGAMSDERTVNATCRVESDGPEGASFSLTCYADDGKEYPLTVTLDRLQAQIVIATGQVVLVRREA